MRERELHAFRLIDRLEEVGDDRVVGLVQPPLEHLIEALAALSEDASAESRLACFEACILALNEHGHEIDTITREVLCDVLYDIGELVGLDSGTNFIDEWRDF